MDILVGKHNVTEVRKALQHLPNAVDQTYDEAWERIQGQSKDDRELAERVFSWMTYARRPLYAEELQHALAVVDGQACIDIENIIDKEVLTSLCAGLVVIDDDDRIRLVRKDPVFDMEQNLCLYNYSLQITRCRNISNAGEKHSFQKLRPVSLRHASRISHSMTLGLASVKIIKN
jgi:hypothetical protein